VRGSSLVGRSLGHYWRTQLAVVLGVATAVAVLAGSLLVGESLRGSLRALVLARLGRTDHAVLGSAFFREALAAELARAEGVAGTCPALALSGAASLSNGGRRAGGVEVWGVDARVWAFHGRRDGCPGGRRCSRPPSPTSWRRRAGRRCCCACAPTRTSPGTACSGGATIPRARCA
jgi:hypothetical protein